MARFQRDVGPESCARSETVVCVPARWNRPEQKWPPTSQTVTPAANDAPRDAHARRLRRPPRRAAHRRTRRNARSQRTGRRRRARRCEEALLSSADLVVSHRERPRRTTGLGVRTLVDDASPSSPVPICLPSANAPQRGRSATEGGDEHARLKGRYPLERQMRARLSFSAFHNLSSLATNMFGLLLAVSDEQLRYFTAK